MLRCTSGSLHVRGVRLAYTDEGSGPIVINAHGRKQSRAPDRAHGLVDWSALPAAGFRLISYDARGHGESEGTPVADTYRWESLAEDLLAVTDHFSPAEPVHAMGISMGTGTILNALALAPRRFSTVTLGAPSVAHGLWPALFRGAAAADLPSPRRLTQVRVPALILAWAGDPSHPVSTAERLSGLLPASGLHVSATSSDVRTWAARAATFFAGYQRALANRRAAA